jgi:hypothetical protein
MKTATFAPDELNLDIRSFAVPVSAYTGMRNMRNVGEGVSRAKGETLFAGAPSTPPKFAASAVVNGVVWLVYMGAGGVFATDGTNHFDISPTTGWLDFSQGQMTAGTLNGFLIFAAGNKPPWYWDRSFAVGAVKPMPGWLTPSVDPLCVAAFGQHAFAASMLGATQQYERLCWSDLAALGTVPASWVPTATNQAGELVLSTGGGPVRAMKGLGPSLMVYRTVGAFAVSFVGRPYIYTARKLSAEAGCASTNSVAEVRGSHVILAPGDLIITDGTTLRSIGEARV